MIHKTPSTKAGYTRVTFELPSCVWADRIYVTGTFNNWNENEYSLQQSRDGIWRVSIELPAGKEYEFRYLVDGRWQTDYHADGYTDNAYGSQNSILDLSLSKVVPMEERLSSKVPDGHTHRVPYLPVPLEEVTPARGDKTPPEMPRLRPRVVAA